VQGLRNPAHVISPRLPPPRDSTCGAEAGRATRTSTSPGRGAFRCRLDRDSDWPSNAGSTRAVRYGTLATSILPRRSSPDSPAAIMARAYNNWAPILHERTRGPNSPRMIAMHRCP